MKQLPRICHLGKLFCSMTSTNFPSGFKVSISIRNDKNEANTIFKASGFFKAIVQIWLRSLFMARAKSTLFFGKWPLFLQDLHILERNHKQRECTGVDHSYSVWKLKIFQKSMNFLLSHGLISPIKVFQS